MQGIALLLFGFGLELGPINLPSDVEVVQSRSFKMPLHVNPLRKDRIQRLRVFVSSDRGKTWVHANDYNTTDDEVNYEAKSDGEYWFSLQVKFNDGSYDPASVNSLTPSMKVFVNTKNRALKPQKTREDLQREVEDLRKTVEQLQNRVKELESKRKSD